MNVEYSKPFLKAVDKLSGKVLSSVLDMIREVKNANGIDEITNCKKLIAYKSVYRIRIGDYRAFFIFHVKIVDDTVKFEYLESRGKHTIKKYNQSYGKRINDNLLWKKN